MCEKERNPMRKVILLLSIVGATVIFARQRWTQPVHFGGMSVTFAQAVGIAEPNVSNDLCSINEAPAELPWQSLLGSTETAFTAQSSPAGTIPRQSLDGWAFVETFDGDPSSPSQDLLPRSFDYVVTHRTHPAEHLKTFDAYPADHDMTCAGPDPNVSPLPQHMVVTSHLTNGDHPDASFYICKNHMMSSMGDVEGYSVSAFWPKQEFDFAQGGVLEFDVNLNDNHPRSWWEVVIVPREQLKVGAAHHWLPIDETYPEDRILFDFSNNKRSIQVGTGALEPDGIVVEAADWQAWAGHHPDDPANTDRRIRRTNRIILQQNSISWAIEKADGTFDDYMVEIPDGLPFTRGLVLFKTHAYTPQKDGNVDNYTFHWDNIRFSGPVVGLYEDYEAEEIVYLQRNGSRSIGEKATVTIDLPEIDNMPVLFGQVHNAMRGQVLLQINDGPQMVVNPLAYAANNCYSSGWESFRIELKREWIHQGKNTFTWEIGPRPACVADWIWDGFSVKNLEVQLDLSLKHKLFLPVVENSSALLLPTQW
ncbi:MAG: hypothetical protein KDE31_35445 [Caldilineaceae bacterium]|nr:hypothetical protein [Caldilineaceae bacterium]MCB0189637.1 hypothetical protein [Caldilineaceae bacterium]